ncbi:exosome component 10 [Xenopus tropicalis]|uniref:Exosome complex component 10 n=2 Tax=Xenopus tropicalis TaxID=8364 RepID=A0A8J0QKG4_XENTR|nr:exosome complex component 10 [Xenopus tropicalis]|eukprot:NP_998833.2 exosome component 10 [Xenopus tropicalis]
MAAPGGGMQKMENSVDIREDQDLSRDNSEPIPGFSDTDAFVKFALGTVVSATKASTGLPQGGDEYDFYRSFPGFRDSCESQGEHLLHCMSQVMQYHGLRSHIRDRSRVTLLEDKFDLLVDANDVILEKVGILLDEASGLNRNQQPILPAGLQPPKTIVSSWNRKTSDLSKKGKSETFRLLHAKNILRPQLKFKEKIDNSNTPFVSKLFVKPNAQKPLPEVLRNRLERQQRQEDLDVPPALADFIHQQRMKISEEDMFCHPYQYELDHFVPLESSMEKPDIQPVLSLQDVPCKFVMKLEDLVALNEKLLQCAEFAVDLEHHSYRSFLGLTCLMQISTRTEDYIIDVLELRSNMYILNESFTNPSIIKVLHGADSDIEWLQKDFGLYIVNMFDTHQAARILNLGRHSLDHLLRLYCNVESDKRYQLADWRIRPLPEEMIEYARADTHYLLFIYDKMRTALLGAANEQQNLLQLVWQKSRDICLKKFTKSIFTEDSYLELYQKQKKHLNTQQLTAFRLLFAWRDKIARQEDESTGYVLPNHMLLKITEELPKEPQGIIACCSPVPPLVRQQINELSLLIHQARETPLLKSEISSAKKKGPMANPERMENLLFGPHDTSLQLADNNHLYSGTGLQNSEGSLFTDEEPVVPVPMNPAFILSRASITIFNGFEDEEVVPSKNWPVSQQKARNILESFENPFKMFLPPEDRRAHVSQAAKLDPNTKMFEISKQWKLVSLAQQEKEAKAKEDARRQKREEKAAREQAKRDFKSSVENQKSVREQAKDEESSKKRERVSSEPGSETMKSDKKRIKNSEETQEPVSQAPFTPFDYSKSDFKMFAGSSNVKSQSEFDPNKQTHKGKKNISTRKGHQLMGNKSMSFVATKSDRGFQHSWPKR